MGFKRYLQVARHEKGGVDIARSKWEKYAKIFNCTVAEVMGLPEESQSFEPQKRLTMAQVGYVGAAQKFYPIDDHMKGAGLEDIDIPPGGSPHDVAVVVRGDSMLPYYRNGDILYYSSIEAPIDNQLNHVCIVKLDDDGVYVKLLKKGTQKGKYNLISINDKFEPMLNVGVVWAARIAGVIYKR